jgi:hypothetical protein
MRLYLHPLYSERVSKSFLDLVKRGDSQEIADWVKDDPQIAESRDAQGVSALLWAVYTGKSAKERANSRSADGWPLLHLAAAFADCETVRMLLDAGADVGQISQTPMRNQALHALLALSKDADTTRLLMERGADVNAVQTAGYRPLHQAAVAGREDLVRMLLDAGADKAARCDRGKTPAEYARERGHDALAAMLG